MNEDATPARSSRRRRSLLLLSLACLAVSVAVAGLLAVRTDDPGVSSEWPRPFDPAKPFNMLGVPGVSAEQRKRAEDLLLRSLQEAPRWSDYQAAVDAGWHYSPRFSNIDMAKSPELSGGADAAAVASVRFVHRINPLLLNDGRMLDPRYPESLVYKVRGAELIFVAYMYIAEPDIPLEDPRISGFAGRLIEWHDHSDVCWQFDNDELVSRIDGFRLPDGSCPQTEAGPDGVDPEFFTGDLDLELLSGFGSMLMTHVWVVERLCGPFSALDSPLTVGVSATPLEERVDLCEH